MDGSGSYKGKAEGSNSSEGLWIGSPAGTALGDATHIYWFESGYDAMSYYQLHQKENKDLRKAVFVSTGGTPTVEQMRGVISRTRSARQHICFDTDAAGREFADNLKKEIHRIVKSGIESTPERKAYLETIPAGGGIDGGNADLLPDALRSCYGKYEAAWEEVMSMRSSGLCHPDDIKEQESLMNRQYRDFRNGLRDFLGLDEKDDTRFVREEPKAPCKDWNDEPAGRHKTGNIRPREPSQRRRYGTGTKNRLPPMRTTPSISQPESLVLRPHKMQFVIDEFAVPCRVLCRWHLRRHGRRAIPGCRGCCLLFPVACPAVPLHLPVQDTLPHRHRAGLSVNRVCSSERWTIWNCTVSWTSRNIRA